MMFHRFCFVFFIFFALFFHFSASVPHEDFSGLIGFGSAKYALLLGLDGLGSMYFNSSSSHPNLDKLIQTGSSSMNARDSLPTVSKPNWAAILAGAGPEETGVDSNSWYYLPNCVNYGVLDWQCIACGSCSSLVPLFQEALEKDQTLYNATLEVVEKVLHSLCDELKFPLKTTCNTLVNLFAEEIFDGVVLNQTAHQICIEIKACRNQLSPLNGPDRLFPTIFKAVKYHNPLLKTVCYTDHNVVVNLIEKRVLDYFLYASEDSPFLVQQLVPIIQQDRPEFVFFHFDNIDEAGHSYGWGSPEYLDAIEQVDSEIGTLLNAYSDAGILNETIVLVVADHGGQGTDHGATNLPNVLIPWIVNGPGIVQGHNLTTYVRDMDIPATALYALGISAPPLWQGKPIIEAWHGTPVPPLSPQGSLSQNVAVVVISGLTSDSLQYTYTPTLTGLISNGASTTKARSVMPSTSLSNIASILMGAGPEETGICSGTLTQPCSWVPPPATADLPPTTDPNQLFPSIFHVLASNPNVNYTTAAYYNWQNVSELLNPNEVTFMHQNSSDVGVAEFAAMLFANQYPNFTLIQFNEVQQAGQTHGYNSSQYFSAVEAADKNLGIVLDSLQMFLPGHFLIVMSDHGGVNKIDGETNDPSMLVPWIVTGPNVRYAFEIENYIRLMDTAALSAFVLNAEIPASWIAKPPLSIFYEHQ